ncbi:MAG: hypothetical protein IKG56_04845 [Clostridia bacterium]|nr:hypothetical protein [Clostridia bacterium]
MENNNLNDQKNIVYNKTNTNIDYSNSDKRKFTTPVKELFLTLVFTIIFTLLLSLVPILGMFIHNNTVSYKPIIYLYPTAETKVQVELGSPQNLTCSYPKYDSSWNVIAKPNGDLIDLSSGRSLYSLYWEGKNNYTQNITEGFCVKGEDSAKFLEEKLSILGLSDREAEEFIIYWLPQLESNIYNIISFETMDEINKDMPLNITPTPDSLIRVMMKFKGVDSYFELPEQILETPQRTGFVAVEWGGTEIK